MALMASSMTDNAATASQLGSRYASMIAVAMTVVFELYSNTEELSSFNDGTKIKINPARMPFFISGTVMSRKTRKRDAPNTRAALSSST